MVCCRSVRYVSDETHLRAREMEQRFASLPPQAGVLFVSIQPQPVDDGKSVEFYIRLGISRRFDEETGRALVKKVLSEEIKEGLRLLVGVYRGVSGACRDDGTPTARSLAS